MPANCLIPPIILEYQCQFSLAVCISEALSTVQTAVKGEIRKKAQLSSQLAFQSKIYKNKFSSKITLNSQP